MKEKTETEESWWRLLAIITKVEKTDTLDELFELLFTHSEREELSRRLVIIEELLRDEKAQREIAKERGVSISKITRGSNALKIISPGLRDFLLKAI